MRELGVGQSVPRYEDARLLRGQGRYTDDIRLAGLVHAVVLRSPHAHARLRAIDTAAAKAAPGVLTVLTGADAEAAGLGTVQPMVPRQRRDGSPMVLPRYRVLALGKVARIGDPAALIVAETLTQAKDAAELVAIDYEPLPVTLGTATLTRPGSAAVWPEAPDNVSFVFALGDRAKTDAAFAAAHHVVKVENTISRVAGCAIEPRGAIGSYDPVEDRYTVWATVQQPHQSQAQLAGEFLRVPPAKVRLIAPDVGGGFGLKGTGYVELCLVAWASRVVGRPVKWMSERSEAFLCDDQARDNVTSAELALDRDGKFLGFRVRTIANLGAYVGSAGPLPPTVNLGGLVGVYTIPACDVEVTAAFSNTVPTAAYRGAGRPEASFAIESAIDRAARELGIDRVELRRRNLIPPTAMPYKTALTFNFDSGDFPTGLAKAQAAADWPGFAARRRASEAKGRRRGIGIAYAIEQAGAGLEETAEVRFDRSGFATLFSGSSPHGQGHETMYKQFVATFLGLDPANVRVVTGDTDQVFHGIGTFGSRSAAVGGAAMRLAAERIVVKARKLAAHMLEVAETDLAFEAGSFHVAGTDRTIALTEVAKASYRTFWLPRGFEPGLSERATFVPSAPTFPNGCHVCEAEIDPETGATAIVRYTVVDDVGRVVNPLMVKGQLHGGIAQGLGQALFEEVRYDADGQLLTASFMDYAMPRAEDMPDIAIETNDVPSTTNPLGIKGAGEAGTVGALPAVMSAVVDALASAGVRHFDMPATPERVWRAIRAATAGLRA
ncbi:MAG: xanthine dehydrogenase family protein molybdopterin-binding subunit [Alphaproteobacteria bacterium]|nr:xanthine dehydrogenase family protein molybdopterin-binding subunit [Alphaproteobacteria bacterium]